MLAATTCAPRPTDVRNAERKRKHRHQLPDQETGQTSHLNDLKLKVADIDPHLCQLREGCRMQETEDLFGRLIAAT